jgi:intracellular sulfur oxidation DsrE/DsrF family protein
MGPKAPSTLVRKNPEAVRSKYEEILQSGVQFVLCAASLVSTRQGANGTSPDME